MEYITWTIEYTAWYWQNLAIAQQMIVAFGGAVAGFFAIVALRG